MKLHLFPSYGFEMYIGLLAGLCIVCLFCALHRSSPTGEGQFMFDTKQADEIYETVRAASKEAAKMKQQKANNVS